MQRLPCCSRAFSMRRASSVSSGTNSSGSRLTVLLLSLPPASAPVGVMALAITRGRLGCNNLWTPGRAARQPAPWHALESHWQSKLLCCEVCNNCDVQTPSRWLARKSLAGRGPHLLQEGEARCWPAVLADPAGPQCPQTWCRAEQQLQQETSLSGDCCSKGLQHDKKTTAATDAFRGSHCDGALHLPCTQSVRGSGLSKLSKDRLASPSAEPLPFLTVAGVRAGGLPGAAPCSSTCICQLKVVAV